MCVCECLSLVLFFFFVPNTEEKGNYKLIWKCYPHIYIYILCIFVYLVLFNKMNILLLFYLTYDVFKCVYYFVHKNGK